jgi:SAM-dependent methyltransferase
MRWLLKASVQNALSWLPAGVSLQYHLFQRPITKSLPCSDAALSTRISIAERHMRNFALHTTHPALPAARLFEFGAGWDLMIPLAYYYLGVRDQTVVDIQRLARPELIADSLRRLAHRFGVPAPLPGLDDSRGVSLARLPDLGIDYRAPVDPARTGLDTHSYDFISNTLTLEHIPRAALAPVLKECFRLLRPGAAMSCLVDMSDHYSTFDKSISAYNFLKFSPKVWALVNSPLHFQNRLRFPDYLDLAREAGFAVAAQGPKGPTQADLDLLRALPLHHGFRSRYSVEQLGVRQAWLVLRKDG